MDVTKDPEKTEENKTDKSDKTNKDDKDQKDVNDRRKRNDKKDPPVVVERRTSTHVNPLFVPSIEDIDEENISPPPGLLREKFREILREEAFKIYPKMSGDVIISQQDGGVLVAELVEGGSFHDKQALRTKDGKINRITGALGEALGPIGEELEMAQRFRPKIQWEKFNFEKDGDYIKVQEKGTQKWLKLQLKSNSEIATIKFNSRMKILLGPTVDEYKLSEEKEKTSQLLEQKEEFEMRELKLVEQQKSSIELIAEARKQIIDLTKIIDEKDNKIKRLVEKINDLEKQQLKLGITNEEKESLAKEHEEVKDKLGIVKQEYKLLQDQNKNANERIKVLENQGKPQNKKLLEKLSELNDKNKKLENKLINLEASYIKDFNDKNEEIEELEEELNKSNERIKELESQENIDDISQTDKDKIQKEKTRLEDKVSDLVNIINELNLEKTNFKEQVGEVLKQQFERINKLELEIEKSVNIIDNEEEEIEKLKQKLESPNISAKERTVIKETIRKYIKTIDLASSHLKSLDERHKVEMESIGKENQKLRKEVQDLKISVSDLEAQKTVRENIDEINKLKLNKEGLKEKLKIAESPAERERIEEEIEEIDGKIMEREKIIERSRQKMSLRFRVKEIFKKHGLSILAVTSVVVTVIGVLITNLSSGLASLGKNLGKGLKNISKKVAAILPGMAGAIASFIFKTAGEVVAFIGKNSWLLIVAVVIAVIGAFKNKTKRKK